MKTIKNKAVLLAGALAVSTPLYAKNGIDDDPGASGRSGSSDVGGTSGTAGTSGTSGTP